MNIPTSDFSPVTLEEMDSVRLMDRIDTKFVAPTYLLLPLLERMKPYFRIQTVDGKRIADYGTQYFDTPALDFYRMHHDGKLNRQKIRIRTYRDSALSFLEVKNKSNKGRTSKQRMKVATSAVASVEELGEGLEFLQERSLFDAASLVPVLQNSFQRLTFVNTRLTERITIDTGLTYSAVTDGFTPSETVSLAAIGSNLFVIELKQDGRERSDFRSILTALRIQPSSFSKYCMGIYLSNIANPENLASAPFKGNRFKYKYHLINKLINKQYAST